jgi:hypothetical protein
MSLVYRSPHTRYCNSTVYDVLVQGLDTAGGRLPLVERVVALTNFIDGAARDDTAWLVAQLFAVCQTLIISMLS